MTPSAATADSDIRECPQCKALIEDRGLFDIVLIGAQYWTDGRIVIYPWLDLLSLVKCPKCGTLFWDEDARELGDVEWQNKRKDGSYAVEPIAPSEMDLLQFLSGHRLDAHREFYARRQAWWFANDKIRMNENATIRFSPLQRRNLRALFNLLDEKHPERRITKAEILRELGQFRECVQLLAEPFEDDRHARLAAFIRSLAEQKVRIVREIKEKENPLEDAQSR